MKSKVEILLSVMNIKDDKEYENLINKNKINGNVTAVNQTEGKLFNLTYGKNKIYSYREKGVSKSRNELLTKAKGDICLFADDDVKYVDNYEEIIQQEYHKNKKAEVIIFFVDNINKQREKNKKFISKKANILEIQRARTYEITIKRETIEKCKKLNIKFDTKFGPGGVFNKGEETVFLSDLLRKGINIYSTNKKIGTVSHNEGSTWFSGYNEKFLYDQGAIFYRISPKFYKVLIFQYIIRKNFLYRKNLSMLEAYKAMNEGAKKCKEIKSVL